jgi:hypothetical protein
MGDVVNFPTSLIDDQDFILAMARYADGLATEAQIKKRFRFDDETWNRLGADDKLVEKIELEKARRCRTGETAREKAQAHFTTIPDELNKLVRDPSVSPRYKIDASRELRVCAANGPESTPATADRFQIIIRLDADTTLKFDKPLAIGPDDSKDIDSTSQESIPMIEREDDDGGESV